MIETRMGRGASSQTCTITISNFDFGIRYQNFDFVWSKIGCKFSMFHPTTPKSKWKSKFLTKIEVNSKWHRSLNPSVL